MGKMWEKRRSIWKQWVKVSMILRVEDKETTISIAAGEVRRLSFFKGAFVEIPLQQKMTREQPTAVNDKPIQEPASEQTAEKREKLQPGYFPLNPRGPIY